MINKFCVRLIMTILVSVHLAMPMLERGQKSDKSIEKFDRKSANSEENQVINYIVIVYTKTLGQRVSVHWTKLTEARD